MNILKRTQGIDSKARSGALMGICEVVLKDALTGKVTDREVKKNMLTNGLSSFYNGCPYALDKPTIVNDNYSAVGQQVPVNDYGLGGIFIFPQALGNDPDLLYPDFASNPPTGFASKAAYTQMDSRQGAYDGNQSRAVQNGWLNVYTWGSNFGNGPIASVALSHRNCYKFFDDLSVALVRQTAKGKGLKVNSINGYMNVIGCNSSGVFLNNGQGSFGAFPPNAKIWKWKKGVTTLELLDDVFAAPTDLEAIWEYPAYGYFCVTESYIYFLRVTTSAATSEFTLYTIDLSDNTATSSNFTVPAYLAPNGGHQNDVFAKRGDYIYLFKYDGSAVYKIDLTQPADIDEITLPAGLTDPTYYGLSLVKGIVIGNGFVIGADDVAIASTAIGGKIFDSKGVWAIEDRGAGGAIDAVACAPYCATHADLAEAKTKTAGTELIVNYTILQV